MMRGYAGDQWGIGSLLLLSLVMLIFWAGAVSVILLLVRRGNGPPAGSSRPNHEQAERILHERFARGEIDQAEYTARHAALLRSP